MLLPLTNPNPVSFHIIFTIISFFSSYLSLKPFCASHFYVYEIKIIKEILCIHTGKWNDCVSVFVSNKVRIVIRFSTSIKIPIFLVYNAILHNINYVKGRMKKYILWWHNCHQHGIFSPKWMKIIPLLTLYNQDLFRSCLLYNKCSICQPNGILSYSLLRKSTN